MENANSCNGLPPIPILDSETGIPISKLAAYGFSVYEAARQDTRDETLGQIAKSLAEEYLSPLDGRIERT